MSQRPGRLELPVTLLREGARLPTRAHEGDAGLDLHAVEPATIPAGERASIGTGIAVEVPPGHAGLVLPRSGLAAKHGIALVNSPGLIDSGYRGEVRVLLLNTDRARPFEVHPGDRVAQLVVTPFADTDPVEAAELREEPAGIRVAQGPSGPGPARGAGGFGSSGR
ncbi:MAG TPA: dUTP diphosphatase [Solirubrobacterales bacterium]|nr:dUTP diphosphatase [Solirubrobacterales bacterium]